MEKYLIMPYENNILSLNAGDIVYITGELLVMRDAAHKKIYELLSRGEKLPFDINGGLVYYMGPCPPKPGCALGSAGPTTSKRMDAYTPALMDRGLLGSIGKGGRSDAVRDAVKRNKGIYLTAIGGAGAYYSKTINSSEVIAFPELLSEAVRLISVENFPAVVAIDSKGDKIT
ncbi:MAG: FumA C-terminus/TtdB family hydratase beta subunit [Christensenellales bacterium]|jgi:fumarate hydratase subunit beta